MRIVLVFFVSFIHNSLPAQMYRIERLPKERVEALLSEHGAIPNAEIQQILKDKQVVSFTPYVLKDGKVLQVFNLTGIGICYESKEHLYSVLDKMGDPTRPHHILRNMFETPEEFFLHQKNSRAKLSERLEIDTDKLNFDLASIDLIQKSIVRLDQESVLDAEVFLPLIIYIGDLIRRHNKAGDWVFKRNETTGTLECLILGKDSHFYNPWLFTYNELSERWPNPRLKEVVIYLLDKGQ